MRFFFVKSKALTNLHNLMLYSIFGENLFHAVLVGVGDEHLAEMVLAHHAKQFGDAGTVQFVENIIQQQDGLYLFALERIVELGQAQSQRERLLLSLRAVAFHRLAVDEEKEIVFVDTKIGEAAPGIRHGCTLQTLLIGAGEQSRLVLDFHFLLTVRQLLVMLLEYRRDVLDEILPAGEDEIAQRDHLLVQNLANGSIHFAALEHLFQQRIALHQKFAVRDELLQIFGIELRDDGVEELAAHLTAPVDDVAVVGRDHHHGEKADVGTQTGILLLVGPHRLVSVFVGATHLRVVLGLTVEKLSVNGEKIRVEAHRKDILRGEIALAERQVIDGVQQVGLATAVPPDDAVHILVKRELSLLVAFEIGNMYVF